MKIIITGAKGFIAYHLIKNLEQFAELHRFDPSAAPTSYFMYPLWWDKFVKGCGGGIDMIIHTGANADSTASFADVMMQNVQTLEPVAETAYDYDCPLIFLSSAQAERPLNPYGWSKNIGEMYFRGAIDEKKLAILRLFNVWGTDESRKHNPSIIYKILHDNLPVIYEDCYRDFIHVKDAVTGIRGIINEWQSGLFHLGCCETMSIIQLYKLLQPDNFPIEKVQERPEDVPQKLVASRWRYPKDFSPFSLDYRLNEPTSL